MMFSRDSGRRARRTIAAGLVAAGFALPLAVASPAAALGPDFSQSLPGGTAYGASGALKVGGNQVTVGRVAQETLPCIVQPGVTYQNHVATFTNPPPLPPSVLDFGTVVNKGVADRSATFADAQESSEVQNLSFLGGLVTADVIKAKAHARADVTGINKFSGGDDHPGGANGTTDTEFVNLKVGNTVINAPVAPNTVIQLPGGIGSVTLNEQIPVGPKRKVGALSYNSGVRVNGLHIRVHVPAGDLSTTADVIVASAQSTIDPTVQHLMEANAYAARAVVGPLNVGKQGLITLGCRGSNGQEKALSVNTALVPGITGNLVGTGKVVGSLAPGHAKATERIEDLNVLDGLLTADVVSVGATATVSGPTVTAATTMEFVNVVLNGQPITINAPQTITVPGVASIQFGVRTCRANNGAQTAQASCTATNLVSASITGILVTLLADQQALPVGTKIWIAGADVQFDKV